MSTTSGLRQTNTSRFRRLLMVSGLAALLALSLGMRELYAEGSSPVANFTAIQGKVNAARGQNEIAAQVGMGTYANDIVSTAHRSRTQISFVDGSKLSMGQDYQMKIREYQYDDANKARKAVLDVVSGVVKVDVAKLGSKTPDFTVNTPSAVISVRGTSFFVTVINGQTYVSVTEGSVTVSNAAGQMVTVTAGQTVQVTATTMTQAFATTTQMSNLLTQAVTQGAAFPGSTALAQALEGAAQGVAQAAAGAGGATGAASGITLTTAGGVAVGSAALAAAVAAAAGGGGTGVAAGTTGTTGT